MRHLGFGINSNLGGVIIRYLNIKEFIHPVLFKDRVNFHAGYTDEHNTTATSST
jgi:hypothetical protein